MGEATLYLKVADNKVVPVSGNWPISVSNGIGYETVAAGRTAQVLGSTGAKGDVLGALVVVPAAADCGAVTVLDNSTSIVVFAGGDTTALADLRPIVITLGVKSVSGAWKITTGAHVSVMALGSFT